MNYPAICGRTAKANNLYRIGNAFFFFLFVSSFSFALPESSAVVYENEACGHCHHYLMDLKSFFAENNVSSVEEKFVINSESVRQELEGANKRFGIPPELQGHMVTVLNDRLVLEGHVPISWLEDYFSRYPDGNFPLRVVYQDLMVDESEITSYKVMDSYGFIGECSKDVPIADCKPAANSSGRSLLFLVVSTGLLAGIHPCTITVLLFFVAFLFTIHRTKADIFRIGSAYIVGIFMAYFLIGLGIFKAVVLFNSPHFAAKAGAALVIVLGLYNILSYFLPKTLPSLGIPKASKATIKSLIHRATVPASFVLGIIVGVCSFGCTAGIYFSILGLLSASATYGSGVSYLLLYNLMFIVPLILILAFASNRSVVERMEKWEESEKKYVKLVAGAIMVLLGLYILYGGALH